MKITVTKILTLTLFLFFSAGNALAQDAGDFRSAGSGDWSDVAVWETFDGTDWSAATEVPGGEATITILDGHDIVLDADLAVTGSITVEGEEVGEGGSLGIADGITLDFDGGTYEHARDGGSIPVANWNEGSTFILSGYVGNGPGNRSQEFYNIVYNNPEQVQNLNFGWEEVTISGSIHVLSTGSARFHFTDAGSGDENTITIMGDVIVEGGQVTTTGSGGAATYHVEVMGDVHVHSGANLAPSRGGGGFATWDLYGDFIVENGATLQDSHNDDMARFVFAGDELQTAAVGADVSYTGTINFTVAETAHVLIAADTEFRFEDELLIAEGGHVDVDGSLIGAEDAVIALEGVLDINDGGTYEHARDGGSIPVANWNEGSTMLVTGYVGHGPGNRAQEYYNFTWNSTGQAQNINIGWGDATIGGTMRIIDSGSARVHFHDAGDGDGTTTTIEGDVIVEGGQLATTGSGGAAVYNVVVMGDVHVHDGANLSPSRGGGGFGTWTLHGDFIVDDGATLQNSNNDDEGGFVFGGSSTQTIAVGADVSYTGAINYTVAEDAHVVVTADTDFMFEDEFLIAEGSHVEVNGAFIKAEDGIVELDGTLDINDGGYYVYARQEGPPVPPANWNDGSTIKFTGLVADDPSGANRSFYNFVWDNPNQAQNIDVGWGAEQNTIRGDVRVVNTGSGRFHMTWAGRADSDVTVNIEGSLIVEGGQATMTGSGGAQTYFLNIGGDLIVHEGANFAPSRGSGGHVSVHLNGDLWVDGGTLQDSHNDDLGNITFVADTTGQVAQSVHISRETSFTGMVNLIVPDSAIVEVADGNEFYTERKIINYGEIRTDGSGQMIVGNHGVYDHARNGGTVPNAEWLDGSTIMFTGMIEQNASNTNQNYHNIVLDTPNMANRGNLELNDVTISGDIHVKNTANNRWSLTGAPFQGEAIFTILGDVFVDAGTFTSHGSGNAQTTYEVHHYGSIYVGENATNFSVTRGSQSGDGTTRWYLYEGSLTMLGGGTQNSNPRSGSNFVFAGQDTVQYLTVADEVDIDNLPIEVLEGAYLDMGYSEIDGNDLFILHEGGTLATSHPEGFDANIQTDARTEIPRNATYVFNGTERQQSSFTLPLAVQTLVIDNEAGVDQSRDITILETLRLVRGEFNNEFDLNLMDGAEIVTIDGYLRYPVGAEITFANLQWPADGEIREGEEFMVYAQVHAPGFTDDPEESDDMVAKIGLNTENVAPTEDGWTWLDAEFNADFEHEGHEYMLDIGSDLEPGTYYYVSSFQLAGGETVYGGFQDGFWDGEENVSGVLTVMPPIPETPHAVGDLINYNGSFERAEPGEVGPGDVVAWTLNPGDATFEIVTDEVYHGDHALKVDFGVWNGTTNDWEVELVNEPFHVLEGDELEVSIWIKADNNERGANLYLGLPQSGDWARYPGHPGVEVDLYDEWTQYTYRHTANADDEEHGLRYAVALNMEKNDGAIIHVDHVEVHIVEPTDADEIAEIPDEFALSQNYPNPFNPATNIQFSLPEPANVSIDVFTIQGQRVATLVQGNYEAGRHTVTFDASSLSSGIYLYRIQAGSFSEVKKMMLVK
ncbi:T9SS type A sorting domain-containing protein [Balneolales bacterium ANBcel1]|nr:T9SS type A sorting domain-containing protein [Balneolales bacterium ANBcel1]